MFLGKQTHDILINGQRLKKVTSIEIDKDINLLTDKATIKVVGINRSLALEVEKKVKRGDHITIALGYNGNNNTELEGFIKSVSTDNDIVIKCEDRMFEFHKAVKAKKLKNVTVEDIASDVLDQLGSYTLVLGENVNSIRFSDFTIKHGSTAFQVLSTIQKKTGLNIYLRGQELHMQLRHLSDRREIVELDFRKHIHASNLKFVNVEENLLYVEVTSVQKSGKSLVGKAGEKGGEEMEFLVYNVDTQEAVDQIAQNYYKAKVYSGVDGTVSTWLDPYATVGDYAKLISPNYTQREGTYLIETEKIKYSKQYDERILGLGPKAA